MRRFGLALAAGLSGASGLALETLYLSTAGLPLGYGRSTAIGLPIFLAGWAIGAWLAGRARVAPSRALVPLGLFVAVLAPLLLRAILAAGSLAPGTFVASAIAVVSIGLLALVQGAFLPFLTRASARDVTPLFAWNLIGSVLGAYGLADAAVAAFGRSAAAIACGLVALAAGLVGALAARRASGVSMPRSTALAADVPISMAQAAGVLGFATAWMSTLQWVGLRLGVLWLGGMQPALRAILCASLIALAVGAALLPHVLPRGRRGVASLLGLCALASLWPLIAGDVLRRLTGEPADSSAWRSVLEEVPDLVRALVLVGPTLLPFGAIVPVLHRALRGESGERLGRLLLHEAWGAVLALPLVQLWIVPRHGLSGAIAVALGCGALAFVAALTRTPLAAGASAVAMAALALGVGRCATPALDAPPLANPALALRALVEDRDFAVAVVDDGIAGERTLLTDGFRAAGTGAAYRYMQALGHLPVLLHPAPRCVAVLALGTGTTLGAVSVHPEVERIDVLELSQGVVDMAPYFESKNHGVLNGTSTRVHLLLGDGRATLGRAHAVYDVITMEPLLPDSPFAVYLYTSEFYACARRALAPGGLVCQWVPPHALEEATFSAVIDAFARAFPWSSVWSFGTQVILVGGDQSPHVTPERFPVPGVDSAPWVRALSDLGLATPCDVVARYIAPCRRGSASARRLTDDDPWIVYAPRRRGPVLLRDLCDNFALLRAWTVDPPAEWMNAAGADARAALDAARALRAAREASAVEEAALRGVDIRPIDLPPSDVSLRRAEEFAPLRSEVREVVAESTFLRNVRGGVAALASDAGVEAARAALEPLLAAAEAHRERADVHLYLSVALSRIGSPAAQAALHAALERCPRIAQTPEGRRARSLGLSDDAWSRLCAVAESPSTHGPGR